MTKFYKKIFQLITLFFVFFLPVFVFKDALSWDYFVLGSVVSVVGLGWMILVYLWMCD